MRSAIKRNVQENLIIRKTPGILGKKSRLPPDFMEDGISKY